MPSEAKGWGTDAADQPLKPMSFERRDLRGNDVTIKISHAGSLARARRASDPAFRTASRAAFRASA